LTKDHKSSTIDASIYKISKNVIVLKPIIIENKVLHIQCDEGLVIDFIYQCENEKPLIWKHVAYGVVSIEGQPCLAIKDTKEGVGFNRRDNFRLAMDVPGVLNINEKVLVHDISSTGISFYTQKKNKKQVGSAVDIVFVGGYEDVHVSGQIVREVELEERNLYGCTIKPSMIIERFLSEEQRRRLAHVTGSRKT